MNQRKRCISFVMDILIFVFRFTYHGFRYVAVFDPPQTMSTGDVQCFVVHTETTVVGHFSSSNPIINQIQHNIQWSQLSNIMSVPTDWLVIYVFLYW